MRTFQLAANFQTSLGDKDYKMAILVVGTVGYDSVKTPFGERHNVLGGSAAYFSIAASYFTSVRIIGVVGDDFGPRELAILKAHNVDTSGLVTVPGRTFRWAGEYETDLNTRRTIDLQLNVFAHFDPHLSSEDRRQPFLFLANIDPEVQLKVLNQMEVRPKLVAADTIDFWINNNRGALSRVIDVVDVLFVNDNEVRLLTGEWNLVKAANRIPKVLVIKRGEHGAMMFSRASGNPVFLAPAYPLERPVDPTGAGDAFAGGFMGYLAATGDLSPRSLRRAAVLGSVMGSFAVESFSVERLSSLTREDITRRFNEIIQLSQVETLKEGETFFRRMTK